MASDSRLIQVSEAKPEDASSLKKYDAILLFGPGLRLTEEQTENIEAAGKKGATVYTFIFSSGSIINHHVDSLQQQQLDTYYNNRSKVNYRNMLHYIRNTFDSRKLFPRRWNQSHKESTNKTGRSSIDPFRYLFPLGRRCLLPYCRRIDQPPA